MQNSYPQSPYSGTQPYMALPEQQRYTATPDPEKVQNAPANFHPSPSKDSIYLPLIKRRVARKTFWIIVGVVGGVILIAIIVGIAVGVSNSKKGGKGVGHKGGKGGKSSGQNTGGDDGYGGGSDGGDGGYGGYDDGYSGGEGGYDDGYGGDSGDYGSDYANDYTTDNGGSSGTDTGSGGSSTDPCQQLVDSGAPWDAISDCMYQQHVTTMEIIDNFDSSDDYTYTYTYNPYSSTASDKKATPHKKLDKAAKGKLGVKLDHAGHKLSGKASKFSGKLGGTKFAHGKHQLANAGKTLEHVKPSVAANKPDPKKVDHIGSAHKLHIPKPETLPAGGVKARSEKFGGAKLEMAYRSVTGQK